MPFTIVSMKRKPNGWGEVKITFRGVDERGAPCVFNIPDDPKNGKEVKKIKEGKGVALERYPDHMDILNRKGTVIGTIHICEGGSNGYTR